jgi:hypothetical protein
MSTGGGGSGGPSVSVAARKTIAAAKELATNSGNSDKDIYTVKVRVAMSCRLHPFDPGVCPFGTACRRCFVLVLCATVQGTVSMVKGDFERPPWYPACPTEKCNKKMTVDMSGNWSCEKVHGSDGRATNGGGGGGGREGGRAGLCAHVLDAVARVTWRRLLLRAVCITLFFLLAAPSPPPRRYPSATRRTRSRTTGTSYP